LRKTIVAMWICFTLLICLPASSFAASGKQYTLKIVDYPILVNGVEYRDDQYPALYMEGRTYIPLAKIGDILGVTYRWNAEKKQVEIGGMTTNNSHSAAVNNQAGSQGTDAKQEFILQEVDYPILVNGVEYRDDQYPALYMEGRTYIPLAKIGDILGVEYRWNAEKKQVEIGGLVNRDPSSANNGLYVTEGTGKYAGYKMLHGYPGQDKYQIYFQDYSVGNLTRYHVTYEDLRGINLNERITWKYNGKTYTHTRSELYSFFANTIWFSNNLSGITQYTLTQDWFLDVFGDVYLDWAEGIGYATDATTWVDMYFRQIAQVNPNKPYESWTPADELVPVDERPEDPTTEEVIQGVEEFMNSLLPDDEQQILSNWISENELQRIYGVRTVTNIIPEDSGFTLELWFKKYDEKKRVDDTLLKIDDYEEPEPGQILTKNGIRYTYVDGEYILPGVYFNIQDLRKLGIIP